MAASRLENADAGLVLTNVVLKADASGSRLTIANAAGEDGRGGRFTLSGTVGIADPVNGPVDVKLALSHLRVVGLDIATAAADGTIAVTGTLSRLRASGNIVIGPADVNLPTSLPPDVAVIPVTYLNDPAAPKKPAAKAAPPAVARHVDLDLKISLGQAVYVRGLGLESRWTGQLAVTGTAAAPVVIGRYAVDKGSLDLLGSMLEITKGELTFSGGTPPAPTFDVRAETTRDNVTAGIANTGDADARLPAQITVAWDADATPVAGDALSGYEWSAQGQMAEFRLPDAASSAPRVVPPGESAPLGWLRFSTPVSDLQIEIFLK